jgi:hypothetical protein
MKNISKNHTAKYKMIKVTIVEVLVLKVIIVKAFSAYLEKVKWIICNNNLSIVLATTEKINRSMILIVIFHPKAKIRKIMTSKKISKKGFRDKLRKYWILTKNKFLKKNPANKSI